MVTEPDSPEYAGARRIVERLAQAGHRALLAGGCVRDVLLGNQPKDYDVATDARPETVEALFQRTRAVGRQFGVVMVQGGGYDYEVATFRSESAYTDGRHPDRVSFTGPEEDARRRDFTINGMFWDPLQDRVLDYVGGRKDLQRGVVRTIGDPDERFREDHLRLIRAVRFASRFEFRIEERTARAIRKLSHLIGEVAAERLQQELRAILTDKHPAEALRTMDELGLLKRILPEIEDTKGCEQPENYHPEGDVFVHTVLTVEKLGAHPDFELALAALLHDIGKPEASRRAGRKQFHRHSKIGEQMAAEVCDRLRLSNDEKERVCWLVRRHMYIRDARKMKDSTLKKLFATPGFDQLAELYKADALASWGNLDAYHYVMDRKESLTPEKIQPPKLIDGNDLLELGYAPGPPFGEILDRVRDSQLDGEISTRQEALDLARRTAESIGAPRREDATTAGSATDSGRDREEAAQAQKARNNHHG